MVSLILSFFIITPVLIFYASGYTYDIKEKKIKKTGVLSIDIKPRDAQILLNNVLIKKKIPVRLSGKIPGTYNLKIEKNGYKTWEKNILISSNQTTYIKDITLIKENLPLRVLENLENIVNIYGNNATNFLILTHKENLFEIYNYNSEFEKTNLLLSFESKEEPKIIFSFFQNLAFIETQDNNKHYLINLDINPQVINIDLKNQSENLEIQWTRNNNLAYLKNEDTVYKIENNLVTLLTKAPSEITYVDDKENLWFLDEKMFLINNNESEKKYFLNDKIEKIIEMDEKRIIAQSDKETIVYKIENGQIGKKNYLPGKDLIFFDKNCLVNSDWEINNINSEAETELINRGGYKINDVLSFDDEGNFLIKTTDKLLVFNPGYFITTEMLNNSEIKNIITQTKKRTLFFFAKIGNQTGIFQLNY